MEATYKVLACMYMAVTPEQVECKVNEPANRIVLGIGCLIHDVLAQRPPRNCSTKH